MIPSSPATSPEEQALNAEVAARIGADLVPPPAYALAVVAEARTLRVDQGDYTVSRQDGTTWAMDHVEWCKAPFPSEAFSELDASWERHPTWTGRHQANYAYRTGSLMRLHGEITDQELAAVRFPPRRYLFDPAGREEIVRWATSGGSFRLRTFSLVLAKTMEVRGAVSIDLRRLDAPEYLTAVLFEVGLKATAKDLLATVLTFDQGAGMVLESALEGLRAPRPA